MKLCCVIVLVLAFTARGFAADDVMDLDDMIESGAQWLQENLDERALAALANLDHAQLERLCRQLQDQLQGDSVIDLAALRQLAGALLPLLEKDEATRPYAAWLRARLDELDVASQLREATPPPKVGPRPNPEPQAQRQIWQRQLARRPMLAAAHNFVPRLKPIFAAQRVPPELVWLAEVESAFDPSARSPVGATGLFQLMPATAQMEGLILRPTDERLHPEKSAAAAAKYLHYLFVKFKDWRLALAAYNVGEGRVRALLTKRKATTFDAIAVYLPAETQMYVPKIEATLQRREGLTLAQLTMPPRQP